MNKNDIEELKSNCALNDHALFQVYQRFEDEKSIEIRNKLNTGYIALCDEVLLGMSYSNFICETKIIDSYHLSYLVNFCTKYGFDSQSLFTENDINYYTIFIDPLKSQIIKNFILSKDQFAHGNTVERDLLRVFEKIKIEDKAFWTKFVNLINNNFAYELSISFPKKGINK